MEKLHFCLAQAILLCLDDACDRTEILRLKEDGARAALDDYDRKIEWKANWVQQVADIMGENAGALGWNHDGEEQSVLMQLLNAGKKKKRRAVPFAGGSNPTSPKSPRSVAGLLKMPRCTAPPALLSLGMGSHLPFYGAPAGAGNHPPFFGAPARSADELHAGYFGQFPVGPDPSFYGFSGPSSPGAGNGGQPGMHGVYGVPGVPGMPGIPGLHASMALPPPRDQPLALDASVPPTGAPSSTARGSPAAAGGWPGMPPMPPYGIPRMPRMYAEGFLAMYGGLSPFAGQQYHPHYGVTDKMQKAKAREALSHLSFK